MFRGVAPSLLASQVNNTAAWALEGPTDGPAHAWRLALTRAPDTSQEHDPAWTYLRLLLAAHFATVATFVPTDVDSHIRHHAWQHARAGETLAAAIDAVDGIDAWDAREVSARVVEVPGVGALSGHDGEWMAVRAGALGRALAAHDEAAVERLVARLDADVERHAAALAAVMHARGRELDALRVIPTVAHNLGDLSRIVEEWTAKSPTALSLRKRYARLGHEDGSNPDPRFTVAGRVNKAVTAAENHRFLALRAARPLRVARALLLPLGPFFDAWGAEVAASPALGRRGSPESLTSRASVVAALLETHLSAPTQQGVLRALAGFHQAHPGGVDAVEPELPARLRKVLRAGAAREALGVPAERFEARMVNRYRSALSG